MPRPTRKSRGAVNPRQACRIVDEFKTADTLNRVHFVDIFQRMKSIDAKNNERSAANTFLVGAKTCTNECFEAHPFFPGGGRL